MTWAGRPGRGSVRRAIFKSLFQARRRGIRNRSFNTYMRHRRMERCRFSIWKARRSKPSVVSDSRIFAGVLTTTAISAGIRDQFKPSRRAEYRQDAVCQRLSESGCISQIAAGRTRLSHRSVSAWQCFPTPRSVLTSEARLAAGVFDRAQATRHIISRQRQGPCVGAISAAGTCRGAGDCLRRRRHNRAITQHSQ